MNNKLYQLSITNRTVYQGAGWLHFALEKNWYRSDLREGPNQNNMTQIWPMARQAHWHYVYSTELIRLVTWLCLVIHYWWTVINIQCYQYKLLARLSLYKLLQIKIKLTLYTFVFLLNVFIIFFKIKLYLFICCYSHSISNIYLKTIFWRM